jgi:hypothetical protein
MQIIPSKFSHGRDGFALLITLIFLGVLLIVSAAIMYDISSDTFITQRNNQFNMSEAAAEAATETALAQMDHDFLAQSISNSGIYYGSLLPNQTGWPIQYVYSNPDNGSNNEIAVDFGTWSTNSVALNSQYQGLYGEVLPATNTAIATPVGQQFNVPATISETLQFASIPLFQFAIFYNINLEMCPGAGMDITGPVFCNGSIWEGSEYLTNTSTVTAVGTNDTANTDPFLLPGYTYAPHGGTPAVNFTYPGQPVSKANALTMPVGTNSTNNDPAAIEAILNLATNYPINTTAAYSTNGQIYLANAADLFITNTASGTNNSSPMGTNTFVYYQDAANGPNYLTLVPFDFYLLKKAAATGFITNYVSTNLTAGIDSVTNVQYAGYSFITNALFYDWRQGWNGGNGVGSPAGGKAVQAVQIDISKFTVWFTNTATNNGGVLFNNECLSNTHKFHPIDSMFVYNGVPLTGTTMPAVRVVHGGILPSRYGFTLATPMPLYVWGNYNCTNSSGTSFGQNSTTYTWPAAFMADSITVLSTSWADSASYPANKAIDTTGGPGAGETTVNAACLEGIVQSTNSNYSGGVENFLRLVESWSSVNLWYNGSIVVMFPSTYATNYWQSPASGGSGYYNAPNRKWAFDTNFVQEVGLPPLTPQSKAVIRGNWLAQ